MLHELKRPASHKRKSIQVGRGNGSGRGNYSTRWLKGQHSRTGFSQKPGFSGWQTPLHMRLPKLRWFKQYFKVANKVVAINLAALQNDDRIQSKDVVSVESLLVLWYGKHNHTFKILGHGTIEKSLTIQDIPCSASAKTAIEKAGWSVQAPLAHTENE